MKPLSIEGAWVLEPTIFTDERGAFCEWYRGQAFTEAVGHNLSLAQANCSVSKRGVLRGIHYADVPPGQAKYVTCASGAVLDVIVDIRVGSPTYGRSETVRLDDENRTAVYLAEGLGHGFMALTDDATVIYLCSQPYAPGREHGIHPLDPELAIDWPGDIPPVLSQKDAGAPGLAEAAQSGALPDYAACTDYYAQLAHDGS